METVAYTDRVRGHEPTTSEGDYGSGTLIAGKYRLEVPLGVGGMGTVWLARYEMLDVKVALKLIRPELRADDSAQRLLTEARVEAKLNHPGIVRVFDYGQTLRGDCFIVMELLEGADFASVLAENTRLSAPIALQILLPVVDALCCAHEHGVVHRDLKPDNIFLTRASSHIHPKLLDFGIAKYSGESDDRHVTSGGTVLGCPAYMAPERARGEVEADPRGDIWSMCVVIYEAIAGFSPFSGGTYADVLRAVVSDDVVPLGDRGNGEPELWQIVRRGLAKERSQRFSSMHELGVALATWLLSRGVTHDITGASIALRWHLTVPPLAVAVPAAPRLIAAADATTAPLISGTRKAARAHAREAAQSEALRVPKRRVGLGLLVLASCAAAAGFTWHEMGVSAHDLYGRHAHVPVAVRPAIESGQDRGDTPPVRVPLTLEQLLFVPEPEGETSQVSAERDDGVEPRAQSTARRRISLEQLDLKDAY